MGLTLSVQESRGSPDLHVLITGADSGFGDGLAETLAGLGYTVHAACYSEAAAQHHADKGRNGFVLDVTNADHRKAAVERITTAVGSNGLYALVNNAGISRGSLVDWSSEADFRSVMEVNFFAHVFMSKDFLPLLHVHAARVRDSFPGANDPRIVNVTSLSARLPAESMACYSAAKHALRAASNILRLEARAYGVRVTQLQPGFHMTPMTSTIEPVVDDFCRLPPAVQSAYGGESRIRRYFGHSRATLDSILQPASNVVVALVAAVAARDPPLERPVTDAVSTAILYMAEWLPTAAFDYIRMALPCVLWSKGRPLAPPVASICALEAAAA